MKKLFTLSIAALATAVCGLASSASAQYADVTATFVLKGKAPEPAAVTGISDPICTSFKITSESLIVNKENNGIANVLLYPEPKSFDVSKADPSVKEPLVAKPLLDNANCRFVPHLLVVQAGQKLEVKNSDKTGHNANFAFIENPPKNQQIPAGGTQDFTVASAEPAPIPVTCGSHTWMKAHVVIQSHPFIGVSNEKGEVSIKGLPVGKINMRVWQEVGKFKELTIGGKTYPVKRGAIELELKPGKNDLGTIELPAASFNP